ADLPEDIERTEQWAAGERRRDAEQGEHESEPDDVGGRVRESKPSRGRAGRLAAGDGDGGELAKVGRHQGKDARREEADEPCPDRYGEREGGSSLARREQEGH